MLNADLFLASYTPPKFPSENHPFKAKPGKGKTDAPVKLVSLRKAVSALQAKRAGGYTKSNGGSGKLKHGRGVSSPEGARAAMKQRAVVKARVVVNKPGKGKAALSGHVGYLERDEVGENGDKGVVYGAEGNLEKNDITDFIERAAQDRHHFRLIISPERGQDIDLEDYTKDFMAKTEHDLGTDLDWVSVAHHNTDNPHVHVLIRGIDERGADLVINRDYVANGFRQNAQDIATQHLGPRLESDIEKERTRNITADRFTPIDRLLMEHSSSRADGLVSTRVPSVNENEWSLKQRVQQIGRLQYLSGLGLADEVESGLWKLDEGFASKLRDLGERNDIVKGIHKRIGDRTPANDIVLYNKEMASNLSITGEVIDRGLVDEITDRKYILVAAQDGKTYHVALSNFSEKPDQEAHIGAVVTLSTTERPAVSKADHNIVDSAALNGGVYDPAKHRDAELSTGALPVYADADAYMAAHIRRANSLVRRKLITIEKDGTYRVPGDLIENITAISSKARDSGRVVDINLDSALSLRQQMSATGPTWIDKRLVMASNREGVEGARFNRRVRAAMRGRASNLRSRGLLNKDNILTKQGLDELYNQDVDKLAKRLSGDFGEHIKMLPGTKIRGTVERTVKLSSGKHAIIKSSDGFALVPVSGGLDKHLGKAVEIKVAAGRDLQRELSLQPQLSIRYAVLEREPMPRSPKLRR